MFMKKGINLFINYLLFIYLMVFYLYTSDNNLNKSNYLPISQKSQFSYAWRLNEKEQNRAVPEVRPKQDYHQSITRDFRHGNTYMITLKFRGF